MCLHSRYSSIAASQLHSSRFDLQLGSKLLQSFACSHRIHVCLLLVVWCPHGNETVYCMTPYLWREQLSIGHFHCGLFSRLILFHGTRMLLSFHYVSVKKAFAYTLEYTHTHTHKQILSWLLGECLQYWPSDTSNCYIRCVSYSVAPVCAKSREVGWWVNSSGTTI